jgi:CO/xanthine dehydrogenase FAD-binding subunit
LPRDAGRDAPRGDLQGPLIALAAQVRWTADGEERVEQIEEFLAHDGERGLVLEIEPREPKRAAFAALRRPHSHGYAALAVSGAVLDGRLRLAATGLAPAALTLRSVDDPTPVWPGDAEPLDDSLASGWYRQEMLPVLVARCVTQMGGRP